VSTAAANDLDRCATSHTDGAVPGATLIVTADVLGPRGSVKIGAVGLPGVGIASATPLTSNVTATKVAFKGGGSFAAHVGKNVTLEMELAEGMVYTVGFA